MEAGARLKMDARYLAVLLAGKSLSALTAHAEKLGRASNVAYVAINKKHHIESILSVIARQIDIWCILSPTEMMRELNNVRDYLGREVPGTFFTSSAALGAVIGYVRYRPLPNVSRIFLLDDWIYELYDIYYERCGRSRRGLFELSGELSTLFIMLQFLASFQHFRGIYLFGCDGATAGESAESSEIYFKQKEIYEEERLRESSIRRDLENFEDQWDYCVDRALRRRGVELPEIINANLASHYKVFEKRNVARVVETMMSLPARTEGDAIALAGFTSWKELLDRVDGEIMLHRLRLKALTDKA